jgi:hypothetical protein
MRSLAGFETWADVSICEADVGLATLADFGFEGVALFVVFLAVVCAIRKFP